MRLSKRPFWWKTTPSLVKVVESVLRRKRCRRLRRRASSKSAKIECAMLPLLGGAKLVGVPHRVEAFPQAQRSRRRSAALHVSLARYRMASRRCRLQFFLADSRSWRRRRKPLREVKPSGRTGGVAVLAAKLSHLLCTTTIGLCRAGEGPHVIEPIGQVAGCAAGCRFPGILQNFLGRASRGSGRPPGCAGKENGWSGKCPGRRNPTSCRKTWSPFLSPAEAVGATAGRHGSRLNLARRPSPRSRRQSWVLPTRPLPRRITFTSDSSDSPAPRSAKKLRSRGRQSSEICSESTSEGTWAMASQQSCFEPWAEPNS